MISYNPFWETLKEKKISTYRIIKMGLNSSTLFRIKDGALINLRTLDDICNILNCEVSDVIKHVKEDKKIN